MQSGKGFVMYKCAWCGKYKINNQWISVKPTDRVYQTEIMPYVNARKVSSGLCHMDCKSFDAEMNVMIG